MTDTSEEDFYEEPPIVLDSKMKVSLIVLGRNKSPGIDGIPIELFQATETESEKILTRLHQQIWKRKLWSPDWKHSVYIPIFKKGDAKDCSNYRTVAPISDTSDAPADATQAPIFFGERNAGFRKERDTQV